MAEVSRRINAPPKRVWAELADGWMYTCWVVGATHIRDVDRNWPDVGAQLHHQVGAWPFTISDSTQVVESAEPHQLVLRARAWPAGEAQVEIEVSPDGAGSQVTMREWPSAGPSKWLHNPIAEAILRRRNAESLERLACLAENRPLPSRDL